MKRAFGGADPGDASMHLTLTKLACWSQETDMTLMTKAAPGAAAPRPRSKLSVRAIREARNSVETTLTNFRASDAGLTTAEAAPHGQGRGRTEVAHDRRPPVSAQLLHAFANPFIAVLMTLAAISSVTDIILRCAGASRRTIPVSSSS